MNLGAYGTSLGELSIEEVISKAKEDYGDYLADLGQPSQEMAKDIGEQLAETHGEAAGKAAAAETWQRAQPFVWVGLGLLAFIAVVSMGRKRR